MRRRHAAELYGDIERATSKLLFYAEKLRKLRIKLRSKEAAARKRNKEAVDIVEDELPEDRDMGIHDNIDDKMGK